MDAFSSIMGDLGKFGGGLGTGLKAVSPITSIMSMINQYSLASKEKSAMDRSAYYAKHPEAVNALVSKYEKPLSSGLTSSVSNVVNANLAEQGLSQAPGIQTQVMAQALAPYQQQQQQMAIAEAFKALGLPTEALAAIQSTMRPDSLAQQLSQLGGGGSGSSPSKSPGGFQIPNTDPSGGPWGGTDPSSSGGGTGNFFGLGSLEG